MLLLASWLPGCGGADKASGVRVTPDEFFSGELKRLKPHVDFRAACFKIAASRSLECCPELEMYCDGQRVDKPKYGFLRDSGAGEVTLSWRRKKDPETDQTYYHLIVGGLKSFSRIVDEPVSKQKIAFAFGPIIIREPVELNKAGDSTIVWAMGTGSDGTNIDLTKAEEARKLLQTAP
jgi:hypothetical protein